MRTSGQAPLDAARNVPCCRESRCVDLPPSGRAAGQALFTGFSSKWGGRRWYELGALLERPDHLLTNAVVSRGAGRYGLEAPYAPKIIAAT